MDVSEVRVCVLRMEGTNNEEEMYQAFRRLGADPELVHLNQLTRSGSESRDLFDYHALMIPGGFSAGDYVRAGAIFAARLRAQLGEQLSEFVEGDLPIGGTCNGFQVLVETGLLPGTSKGAPSDQPTAVLTDNVSGRFECRPIMVRHVNKGNCVFTRKIPKGAVLTLPVAHAEGNLQVAGDDKEDALAGWRGSDQVVFEYAAPGAKGKPRKASKSKGSSKASVAYPWNPNGAMADIAGICNAKGTVFGMMPHPERHFYRHQHPDWTRGKLGDDRGDGRVVFESVLEYLTDNFLP